MQWYRSLGSWHEQSGAVVETRSQILGDVPDPLEVGRQNRLIEIVPEPKLPTMFIDAWSRILGTDSLEEGFRA
jgi:hypothetical protein